MQLYVNGHPIDIDPDSTISDLLADLQLSARGVAIERNREIIPKSAYDHTALSAMDRLEIVHFVGGG